MSIVWKTTSKFFFFFFSSSYYCHRLDEGREREKTICIHWILMMIKKQVQGFLHMQIREICFLKRKSCSFYSRKAILVRSRAGKMNGEECSTSIDRIGDETICWKKNWCLFVCLCGRILTDGRVLKSDYHSASIERRKKKKKKKTVLINGKERESSLMRKNLSFSCQAIPVVLLSFSVY